MEDSGPIVTFVGRDGETIGLARRAAAPCQPRWPPSYCVSAYVQLKVQAWLGLGLHGPVPETLEL